MPQLSDYFNLKKSFTFYGAYHEERRNQLIHIIFVPAIFMTALTFASYVNLGPFTLADAAAVSYAASFVVMEPLAGLAYAPLIAGMHHLGTTVLTKHLALAAGIHIFGWAAQIFAHFFFERNKPAFLQSIPQSLHAAVFFVWLEVLFALGYKPALFKELRELIKARKAAESRERK